MPIHVHVKNAEGTAKFEIDPLRLVENGGMKNKDIYLAESIIEENTELIKNKWAEHFSKEK